MAKRKNNGKWSKKGNFVDFYGTAELLKKIEAAGGRVEDAVTKAVQTSAEIPAQEILRFMQTHKLTGDTEKTFTKTTPVWKDGKLSYAVGFDSKHGGLPALFLDIGTPTQKPYFYVYYAVNNNLQQIKEAQEKALQDALKGLL